jgi:hypothetical protein
MDETHLCSWWQLSMKRGSLQDEVRVSECTWIIRGSSTGPQKSSFSVWRESKQSWGGKRCVWSVKDQCTEWSHMFPLLNNWAICRN